jgi:hypothetical protein
MTGDGGKDLKTDGLGLIAKGLTEALGELKELGSARPGPGAASATSPSPAWNSGTRG